MDHGKVIKFPGHNGGIYVYIAGQMLCRSNMIGPSWGSLETGLITKILNSKLIIWENEINFVL